MAPDSRAYVSVSDDVLGIMGLTRSQFIERLAAGFFPERSVDVLISTTDLIGSGQPDPARTTLALREGPGAMDALVAVEVRRTYRIPRSEVNPEVFEGLDQLVVTDGEIRVTVQFRRGASAVDRALNVR